MVTCKQVVYLIKSDLHRYYGRSSFWLLIRELCFGIGFKFSFWMRLCKYCGNKSRACLPLFILSRIMLRRYMFKFGIQISYLADIGPGFYIGHFGQIVVTGQSRIGSNCNISHGVTIGVSHRGPRAGAPIIGDDVYIGPGAKIIGSVRVGHSAAVGANAVVTRDVPDKGVAVGVPAKVISSAGSSGYINNVNYARPGGVLARASDQ